MIKLKLKAFTLVELIIVITILVILATIAFISYNSYTVDSRDASRLSTLKNIKDGLDRYYVQTGDYPMPDNIYLTGQIKGKDVNFVGYIGDDVTRAIKMNPVPLDPLTGDRYIYSITTNKKKFQIALLQEKKKVAKVDGNYNGLLKFGDKIYNLPSLVFTGNTDLFSSTGTYFITEDSKNLPYNIVGNVIDKLEDTNEILERKTGKTNITLTGITLPTDKDKFTASGSIFETALGYTTEAIGIDIFGTKYITSNNVQIIGGVSSSSSSGGCNVTNPTADNVFAFYETTGTITGVIKPICYRNTPAGNFSDVGIDCTTDPITNMNIPCKINLVDVVSIGNGAFYLYDFYELVLPNTLKTIGNEAFFGNYYLTSITIPSSVTSIGENAFYSNPLTEVTIESNDTDIGISAFSYHWTLTGTGHAGTWILDEITDPSNPTWKLKP